MTTPDDSIPDVETTNWNAVKLLATKYGIQLRSLDEIKVSRSTPGSLNTPNEFGQRECSSVAGEGRDCGGDMVEDLGIGTPFMITARAVEGGRVIYRFKWRGNEGVRGDKGVEGNEIETMEDSSETGYDPGSDSPSSSFGKSAIKRKQASSRTLKTKRSIPGLRNISSSGNLMGTSNANQSEKKRNFTTEVKDVRQPPAKIQRGDVLGAILGLREGITAQDYSWIEGRRDNDVNDKARGSKGKSREKQGAKSHLHPSVRRNDLEPGWRSISPFGEPVLQRNREQHSLKNNEWQRSPIPRLTDFGQPLFTEEDNVFQDTSPQPAKIPVEPIRSNSKDKDGTFIFDVLQRYTHRGIEPLDGNSSVTLSSPTRAREASSSSSSEPLASPGELEDDQFQAASSISATPGDDPRFALWAVRSPEDDDGLILSSRDGAIDHVPPSPLPTSSVTASPRTVSGKRWSVRGSVSTTSSSVDSTSAGNSPSFKESKHSMLFPSDSAFLIAASTSCLVAELTSRIDTRLLTDFFYTYRAYLSSHDLLHLLTLRFKWSMATPTGRKDEARRKIVRVRTYVVLKYWLTNFFEIDFLPNRDLRRQLTDWLNTVGQDDQLPDLSIIKSLKKIVRGLKRVYDQAGVGGILFSESPEIGGGDRFRDGSENSGYNQPDSAVNLEWSKGKYDGNPATPPARSMGESTVGLGNSDTTWKTPSSAGVGSPLPAMHNPPPPLPLSQNAISRVFVNTVGKLSRFKRNLNSRAATGQLGTTPEGSGFDGLEFEANDSGDLLFIRGGVENFINFFNLNVTSDDKGQPIEDEPTSDSTTAQDETPSLSATSNQTSSTPASSIDLDSARSIAAGAEYGLGISQEYSDSELNHLDQNLSEEHSHLTKTNLARTATAEHLHHFQSDQTLRSVSTAQPSVAAASPHGAITPSSTRDSYLRQAQRFSSPKGPDNIVQIDDIDLSSDEDDGMVRRALRRLPGARDLRMANHVHDLEMPGIRTSMDSVSVTSFGRVYPASQRSLSSHYQRGRMSNSYDDFQLPPLARAETPRKIGIVQTEMLDPDEALRGYELVKGFRLDQLDSDDEEPGDVEAALRRLEGFIDEDKQKEKARKVEAMWLRSQAQRQNEEEEAAKEANEEKALNRQSAPSIQQHSVAEHGEEDEYEEMASADSAPSVSPVKPTKKRPTTQGGLLVPSAHRTTARSTARNQRVDGVSTTALPSLLWAPPAPVHRSFLLNYRSEIIAQQFCLIESELFKAVTWQELVSDQWKRKQYPGQVLDWESFYQANVRRKAEAQKVGAENAKESNVEAIVARFNLTCNWVASEVVLTRHVDDRAAVICKLIRIAWKCYHHSNFATLTQIILGLQSPWVERLSKTWSRVGMLEMRMLRDLKAFINPARNFKHLRTSMRNMIVQGGMEDLITSSGPPKGGYKSNQSQLRFNDGCIPFFGLFLSDLAVNDTLPTFIEPSSPNSSVDVDSTTGHLRSLADPNAFAHLPSLPKNVSLSPLVNLYKYRIIAITVKSVLAFQERLNSYEFQADANVYVKTLRIRCLEGEQLTQISHLVEP